MIAISDRQAEEGDLLTVIVGHHAWEDDLSVAPFDRQAWEDDPLIAPSDHQVPTDDPLVAPFDHQAWEDDLSVAFFDRQTQEVGLWVEKIGHSLALKGDLSTVISCRRHASRSNHSHMDGHCCELDSEMRYREHRQDELHTDLLCWSDENIRQNDCQLLYSARVHSLYDIYLVAAVCSYRHCEYFDLYAKLAFFPSAVDEFVSALAIRDKYKTQKQPFFLHPVLSLPYRIPENTPDMPNFPKK